MDHDIRTKNEYQLTDAFQIMIDEGHTFNSLEIDACLDCGIPDTILSTNRILLEREGENAIHPSAVIENSDLTHCSISENCHIENSGLENVIMLPGSRITNQCIENRIVGLEEILVEANIP